MIKLGILLILHISATIIHAQDIKIIQQASEDIIYVPSEDRIYASVPADEVNGNSICKIDPYFGIIEECFFIGGNPNKLALTNDGNFLYIGLEDLPRIIKFNLNTKSVDKVIELGRNDENLWLYVEDLAVIPELPDVIAVARKKKDFGTLHQGVAIYENGIKRPLETGASRGVNVITPSPNNKRIFGYNNETSDFGLHDIGVNQLGAFTNQITNDVLSGYETDIKNLGNIVYASSGQKINFETSVPNLIGTYFVNSPYKTVVLPAKDSNVVYFAKSIGGVALLTFDKSTFELIDSLHLPNVYDELLELISWGEDNKLAFNTRSSITIIRECTPLYSEPLILSPDVLGACYGDTVIVSAPDGYEHYRWSNGEATQSITVTFSYDTYFYVLDTFGCIWGPSDTIWINFNLPPDPPTVVPMNVGVICKGQSIKLFASASPEFGIMWSNGQTTPEIEASISGDYFAVSHYPSGCQSEKSNVINLTVLDDTIPDPPVIEIFGSTTNCDGESVTLNAPPGYEYTVWNTGQTTPSIQIFNTPLVSLMVGHNPQCLSDYAEHIYFTWNSIPSKPWINVEGNTLASSANEGNQWYFNGNPIPGADKQIYEAIATGFYSVRYTFNGCTSDFSDLYNHLVLKTIDDSKGSSILIFPNPTSDQINIISTEGINHMFHATEVFDFTGNALLRFTNTNTISLNNLPNGLYIVRVSDKSGNVLKNELISKL